MPSPARPVHLAAYKRRAIQRQETFSDAAYAGGIAEGLYEE